MLGGIVLAASLTLVPEAVRVEADCFFEEWEGLPALAVDQVVSGALQGAGDLQPNVQVVWVGDSLHLAAQIRDDVFQPGFGRGGDGLELAFVTGGTRTRFEVVVNDLEEKPPVLRRNGKPYGGGRISGTTRKDGWAVELSIPLSDLPGVREQESAFAVVIRDVDHDGTRVEAVVASAAIDGERWPTTPNLTLDPALGLYGLYVRDRGEDPPVWRRTRGDVAGTPLHEEVVVNEADVVVLGRGLPENATYFYFTHGWGPGAKLLKLELMELDGRPGAELVVEHSQPTWDDEGVVEVLEVYGVSDGLLKRLLAAKVAEGWAKRAMSLRSAWRALPAKGGKGPRRIEIGVAKATGVTVDDYPDPDAHVKRTAEPLPLPWNEKKPVVYTLDGEFWQRAP